MARCFGDEFDKDSTELGLDDSISSDEDVYSSDLASSPDDTSNSSTEADVEYIERLRAEEQSIACEKLVERSYQTTLLEMVKVQNTIICLPTGSGKTFIAVQLIKHFLRGETKSDQIIVFAACSVPLIHQQAKYLRDHISPSFSKEDDIVMELTGDLNIDIYSKDSLMRPIWEDWMKRFKIFVMTAQIFLDCLKSANIKWSNVSLVIFDECHNAVGDHCMVGIMKHYWERKSKDYQSLPRILGLTATIINGGNTSTEKVKIKNSIKEIENRFDAKAVTHHKYEEVLAHSTNASTKYISYKTNPVYSWNIEELTSNLQHIQQYLKALDKSQFDDRCSKIKDIEHLSLNHMGQVFASNAKTVPQKLGSIIKDIIKVLKDLGPYCARIACQIKRSYLLVAMEVEENGIIKYFLELVDTALLNFGHQLDGIMRVETVDQQVLMFVSDKLMRLCLLLEANRGTPAEPLCGLVFGEQRLTVQVLSWYFEDRAVVCPRSSHIKAYFVVGNASVGTDYEEARVTSAKQAKIIERFHKKEYNLLFATKVLEEGINVPSCNIVIRFDDIQAYPSYVQSMGRARKRDASFYVFLEEAEASKRIKKLKMFKHFNEVLAECMRESVLHIDDDGAGGNDTGFPAEEVVPYCPGGTLDSPQLTETDAISRAHRYCATLSCDRLVNLSPVCWWKRVAENLFRAYVLLPSNSVHREIIEGPVKESKVGAKRSAFFKTCMILHEKRGLNDQFLPIPREIPPVIMALLDEIEAECKNDGRTGKAGTNKKTKWYPKKVPQTIITAKIRPGFILNTYAIIINQTEVVEAYSEEAQLYNFEHRQYLFGIVTSADLSKIKPFTLFARSGTFLVMLKKIDFCNHAPRFTPDEIKHLRDAQDLAFIHLAGLPLNNPFFEKVEAPFLITPIKKIAGGYELDWEFSKILTTFDDTVIHKASDHKHRKPIDVQRYNDAIVVPWHGNADPKAKFCVVEVLEGQSPQSSFVENPTKFESYSAYYKQQYGLTPFNLNQPLLKCKQIRSQLNFLTSKFDSQKKKEKSKVLPRLLPEFCNLSLIPSSYYLQAKFLPSIIHRMFRLLMSSEIKESVAKYFSWDAAFADEKQPEQINNFRDEKVPMPGHSEAATFSTSKASKEGTVEKLVGVFGVTLGNSCWLSPVCLSKRMSPNRKTRFCDQSVCNWQKEKPARYSLHSSQYESSSAFSDVDAFHYEYKHPMQTTREEVTQFAREKKKRAQVRGYFAGHSPPPSKQAMLGISMINTDQVHFKSLDRLTDFSKESGPSTHTIMEALTLSKANDSVSLERLEIIGDSVLKLFVSQFIYTTYPEWQEGQMTNLRNKLVSNAHLYYFAKMNDLGEILSGGVFKPEYSWLPPGYICNPKISMVASTLGIAFSAFAQLSVEQVGQMDENALLEWAKVNAPAEKTSLRTCYTHSEFGDKRVADSVEALIGAYFLHGGLDSAMRFMEWIGLRGPGPNGEKITYGRPPPVNLNYPESTQTQILASLVEDLETLLQYKFKNQWLLVEAFTHPGFKGNRTTGGFQRLEFLGDAILDFLVTNHIYPMVNTPGKLTDLKSALVNNVTFGSLTVRYDFHKYLLASSKLLQDTIDKFVEYQEQCGYQVQGHFKLLNDMECLVAEDVEVPKILGDLFESLTGAVYIDSGMSLDTVWKVFYRLMKNEIDIFTKDIPLSPIRELYERFPGKIKFIDPTEGVSGNTTNELGWTIMRVRVPGLENNVYGCGTNKKNAKTAAAKCAIKKLNELNQLELEEKQLTSGLSSFQRSNQHVLKDLV